MFRSLVITYILFSSGISYGASPLEMKKDNYIFSSDFGYSTPSVTFLSFEGSEYIKAHPGFLWFRNFYFSTGDVQMMGNNIFRRKDDEGNEKKMYIHTLYVKVIRAGYLYRNPDRDLVLSIDLHAGVFYSNDVRELNVTEEEVVSSTRGGAGTSLGLRWTPGRYYLDILFSIAGSNGDDIIEGYVDFGYKINHRWKIGIFSEGATRGANFCDDTQEDTSLCKYKLNLTYVALYGSYRFYKDWWVAFGFGTSSMDYGTDAESTKIKASPALYLSIK
ncbi:MAG: hypothetical protein JXR95_15160 [Deltaproteobacteria bacterium]|nr:hypothetical protein [Deltaproteobacteria bacterium]